MKKEKWLLFISAIVVVPFLVPMALWSYAFYGIFAGSRHRFSHERFETIVLEVKNLSEGSHSISPGHTAVAYGDEVHITESDEHGRMYLFILWKSWKRNFEGALRVESGVELSAGQEIEFADISFSRSPLAATVWEQIATNWYYVSYALD